MESISTVLVTGANGFVGKNLIKRLSKEGYKVKGLVHSKGKDVSFLKEHNVEIFYGSIGDRAVLSDALQEVSCVVNLAAAHGKKSLSDMNKTNVDALGVLLDACSEKNIPHMVHFSSVAVYGEGLNITEESPRIPYDAYGVSKKLGDDLIEDFTRNKKLKVSIVQPPHIYGPLGNTNVTKMFRMIKKGRYFVIGKGDNFINAIFVEDLVNAVLLVMGKKESWGEVFIVAYSRPYTLRSFSNIIADTCGVSRPLSLPLFLANVLGSSFDVISKLSGKNLPLSHSRVRNMVRSRSYKVSKVEKELGFSPQFSFEEGSRVAYKSYREEGFL